MYLMSVYSLKYCFTSNVVYIRIQLWSIKKIAYGMWFAVIYNLFTTSDLEFWRKKNW